MVSSAGDFFLAFEPDRREGAKQNICELSDSENLRTLVGLFPGTPVRRCLWHCHDSHGPSGVPHLCAQRDLRLQLGMELLKLTFCAIGKRTGNNNTGPSARI